MNYNKKELDIVKFNDEFEQYDISNKKFQEKKYKTLAKQKYNDNIEIIDKTILKMRLAFDFILNKVEFFENPIPEILQNEELTQGTIVLFIFVGLFTMLLSGLMLD